MPDNRAYWDALAADYQRRHGRALADDVVWGPSMPPERELRVLGDLAGKDVLEVGCGGGQAARWVARQGARRVVGADPSREMLAHARAASEKVEWIEAGAEDLSFLPEASMDIIFSAFAYGWVLNLDRAFAEAFRVLRPGGRFAFSWASPLHAITELTSEGALVVWRSYFDRAPFVWRDEHGESAEAMRTYGDWHAALVRAGFIVTAILEPPPVPVESTYAESHPLKKIALVPGTTIWRARR